MPLSYCDCSCVWHFNYGYCICVTFRITSNCQYEFSKTIYQSLLFRSNTTIQLNINHFKLFWLTGIVINYNREWKFIQHIIPSFPQYHLMTSCAYTNIYCQEGTGSRLRYTYHICRYYIDINSIMIILLTCSPIAHLLLSNLHPKYRHYDDPLGQLRMTTHC